MILCPAITAGMVNADYLFSHDGTWDCLYTDNPRLNPDAQPIAIVSDISTLKADVSTAGSSVGTGGMLTKLIAAELATSVGVTTIITRGSDPQNIAKIMRYSEQFRKPRSAVGYSNSGL